MHVPHTIDRKAHRWSVLLAGTALAASASHADAQDWTKHFRIGLQLALNIKAEFTTAGTIDLSTRPGTYDDGYVLPDGSGTDTTTFWGYDHASQYNSADNTLTFHRVESYSIADAGKVTREDEPYLGMELAYGGPIHTWHHAFLGWEVGYSFLPIAISDRRRLAGSLDETIGVYSTAPDGQPISPPPAGYRGTRNPGPAIVTDPLSSDLVMFDGTITGPRTLDVGLHNFRFGPTLHYEFARRLAIEGSAGGVLGIVSGDYRFNETITSTDGDVRKVRGRFGTTDVVYGGYVNSVLLFHVEEHGDIYAGVQFTSMSDSEVSKGGRSARLDLGAAFSLLIGVNWPF
jgi:hypothetical protein